LVIGPLYPSAEAFWLVPIKFGTKYSH